MCHPDSASAERVRARRSEIHIPLSSGEELPASWRLPERGNGPAVVVVPDIYGRTSFYEELAARLTGAGYVTLLPDLFFRQGELAEVTREAAFARHARLDERGALRDLEAALGWLRRRPEIHMATIGLLGFCLGGTFALDLAAWDRRLAVACYYAFPYGMTSDRPAPRPIDLTERIRAPVLAFWGDQDYIALAEIHAFSDAMSGPESDYEYVVYPGQGHGFLRGLVEEGPATPAAADSWSKALSFFAARLSAHDSP